MLQIGNALPAVDWKNYCDHTYHKLDGSSGLSWIDLKYRFPIFGRWLGSYCGKFGIEDEKNIMKI